MVRVSYQLVIVYKRLGSGGLNPGQPESMAFAVSIRPPSQRAKRIRPCLAHSGTELLAGPAGHSEGYFVGEGALAGSLLTWAERTTVIINNTSAKTRFLRRSPI